jgi:hypothetical protein
MDEVRLRRDARQTVCGPWRRLFVLFATVGCAHYRWICLAVDNDSRAAFATTDLGEPILDFIVGD